MESKVIGLLEKKLMPIANKMNRNKFLASVKDGFLITVPIIIFGAICTIIPSLPYLNKVIGETGVDTLRGLLGHASSITMNLTALIISFSIAYNLCRRYKVDSLFGGFIGLLSFLMLIPFSTEVEGKIIEGVIPVSSLGAQGMFLAMIASIFSAIIYKTIVKKGWTIKMPEGVPEAVSRSFSSLIPMTITLAAFLLIRIGFTYTGYKDALTFIYQILQIPLMGLGNNLISTLIAVFFINLFWFFGLHGTIIVYSVLDPIWMSLSQQNFDLIASGQQATNVINKQFIETFFNGLGGPGGIFGVVLILLFICKSKQLKELGKLSAPANLFNVMETVAFGLPVVLNPTVIIPFILCPLITTTIAYFATISGLVPIATVAVPWTVPPIINGIVATGSLAGGILQIVNIAIAFIIWLPFIKSLDRQALKNQLDKDK
ncbi:PTS sugar transporter subunit IIC [Clostridium oceanicum]|uniref:Permease IIC component n=1 Tax=Clostridium oceanicum TaxID=1543 RepID=A0ABN1JCL4_9CLOT